jgi:hypothetical protein
MDSTDPSARPDGFARAGKLIRAALDPASTRAAAKGVRKGSPSYAVIFGLLHEDLAAGGNGVEPLYDMLVATTISVRYLVSEWSERHGQDPAAILERFAEGEDSMIASVLRVPPQDDCSRLIADLMLEDHRATQGTGSVDLADDLGRLAALLAVRVADGEGVETEVVIGRTEAVLRGEYPDDGPEGGPGGGGPGGPGDDGPRDDGPSGAPAPAVTVPAQANRAALASRA